MRRHFQYKETAVTIEADEEYLPLAEKAVLDAREEVEAYIAKDPYFKATFDPYPVRADMGEVVRHMCEAAQRADVGPMAAVAGAIGHHAVAAMTKAGCKHCLVDNGGDIVMRTNRTVTVGLYSSVRTPNYLALEVPPRRRRTAYAPRPARSDRPYPWAGRTWRPSSPRTGRSRTPARPSSAT